MTNACTEAGAGKLIAERLGLTVLGVEGHDLKCACIACDSSDALRVHQDKGIAQCFSCGRAWSAFDLCKTVLRDHQAAIQLMVDAQLFDPSYASNGNGKTAGRSEEESVEYWARKKGCTVAGFKAYGARGQKDGSVVFPAFGPDGSQCTTFTLSDYDEIGRKGRFEKGKSAGLFVLDGTRPSSEGMVVLVEGVKDASVLHDLGFYAVGLNTNALNPKFSKLFEGVAEVVIVPDGDRPGVAGALKTAAALAGTVPTIRIASLPVEIEESHGADVRDVLQSFGSRGPDAIRRAIDEARPADELVGQEKGEPSAPAIEFQKFTCAELIAAEFELRYLIDRVLVEAQPCILAGPKKSLKTSLLIDLALALSVGGQFLGKFGSSGPVNVGLMSGESGLATIQETILRIAKAQEIDAASITNLIVTDSVPRFGVEEYDAALRALIDEHQLQVLIVDPAYMAIPGDDAGNLMIMGERLRAPAAICQAAGCTLVLAHHTRKNVVEPFAPPELEDIAWAGFQEFARQWFLVGRRQRYEPGTGCHRLWLSIGGSAGHSSLWGVDIEEGIPPDRFWDVAVLPPDDIREGIQTAREEAKKERFQEQLEDDRKAIVGAMIKHPDGETKTFYRDLLGMSGTKFSRALASLIQDGTVTATEIFKGGKKRPLEAFRLSDQALKE